RRAEGCPNREFTARAAPWARRISCFPAYQLLTNHADTAEFPSSSTTGFGLCHRRGWGRSGPTLQGHRLEHIEGFAQGVVLRGTRGRARLRWRDVGCGFAFAAQVVAQVALADSRKIVRLIGAQGEVREFDVGLDAGGLDGH